jgi:hypothetical protein
MTDYALSAPTKADMYAAYEQVGVLSPDGEVLDAGTFADGGGWTLNNWGDRYIETGTPPVLAPDGLYWCVLRWNGDAPMPDMPKNVTIAWRSDAEPPTEYPAGLSRFA